MAGNLFISCPQIHDHLTSFLREHYEQGEEASAIVLLWLHFKWPLQHSIDNVSFQAYWKSKRCLETLACLWKPLLETGDSPLLFQSLWPNKKCPKVNFISVSNSAENSWLWCWISLIFLPSCKPCNSAKAAAHTPPNPEWFNLCTKIDVSGYSLLSCSHHWKLDLKTVSSVGKDTCIDCYVEEWQNLAGSLKTKWVNKGTWEKTFKLCESQLPNFSRKFQISWWVARIWGKIKQDGGHDWAFTCYVSGRYDGGS